MKSSKIPQVGPKSNDNCLYKTRREDMKERRRPCEDGGKDWSDAAISQGMPEAARSQRGREGFSTRAFRGGTVLLTT